MSTDLSTGVLVVGAGPTGLTLAAELGRRGVPCRLIEKATERSPYSKAVAIQARTLETLTLMRCVDEFIAQGHRLTGGNVYSNGKHIIRLTFDGLDTPYPYILTLPQPETERILETVVTSHGVQIERGVELTTLAQDDAGVTATLTHADGSTESVRCEWLAGCDGAKSTVREQIGAPFEGHTYPQIFALADVDIAWELSDDAAQVFTEKGALCGIFPFGGSRYRIVIDEPPWPVDHPASLGEWQALVEQRTGTIATLSNLRWTTTFHVNSRLVKQLRTGRVFLAGDAAHIHSPAGGQGMNTGIQDAVNLAWKIGLVRRGVVSSLLDSYERERYPVERGVLRQTDFLINLVGAHGGMAAVLRDHFAPVVSKLGVVQRNVGRLVSEIAIRYHGSEIVEDHLLHGGAGAGSRAPDALAKVVEDGRVARILDLCARPEHTLLALVARDAHQDAPALCASIVAERVPEILRSAIVPIVITDIDGELPVPPHDDGAVRTPRTLRDEYGDTRPALYLIRPDGYVAFRATMDVGGEAALCRYLERLVLGGPPAPTPRMTAPPAC